MNHQLIVYKATFTKIGKLNSGTFPISYDLNLSKHFCDCKTNRRAERLGLDRVICLRVDFFVAHWVLQVLIRLYICLQSMVNRLKIKSLY